METRGIKKRHACMKLEASTPKVSSVVTTASVRKLRLKLNSLPTIGAGLSSTCVRIIIRAMRRLRNVLIGKADLFQSVLLLGNFFFQVPAVYFRHEAGKSLHDPTGYAEKGHFPVSGSFATVCYVYAVCFAMDVLHR